jgi:integrase
MRAMWLAFEQLDPLWRALFQLCTLTAQRVGEVLQIRWTDIDDGWWTVPATCAKSGFSHRVPLSPQALQILSGLQRRGEYVFGAPRAPERPLKGYRKAFKRACAFAGVANVCAHDLRRTSASMMTSMGVSRLTVGQILNHADRSVTAIYDRYSYDVEKRAALELWAKRMCAIMSS